MDMTRREWLSVAGALPFTARARAGEATAGARADAPVHALPDKAAFAPMALTYLDSGSQHPLPLGAKHAAEAYLASRSYDATAPKFELD
jgi:hypothetical protein